MQFIKKTSSRTSILGIIIKLSLFLITILILVFLLNKIDFPAPKKEIEKLFLMKILRLLNKKNFSIILIILFSLSAYAEDKLVDIWNIDEAKVNQDSINSKIGIEGNQEVQENTLTDIYKMQSEKKSNSIELDTNLSNQEIKIFGLYDPEDYGLDINMWSGSDGDQLKNIFYKIDKINLSIDASEIMQISLLTNSYLPKKNITQKNF